MLGPLAFEAGQIPPVSRKIKCSGRPFKCKRGNALRRIWTHQASQHNNSQRYSGSRKTGLNSLVNAKLDFVPVGLVTVPPKLTATQLALAKFFRPWMVGE